MDLVNEFAASFGLVNLDHVGIAVRDVDDAIARYRSLLGIGDWRKAAFDSTATWRGVEEVIGGNVATAAMGAIRLELVEPTRGAWTPVEYLDERGEGIYHLGYTVSDLADTLERLSLLGVSVDLVGHDEDGPLFAYLDPDPMCGVTVELIGSRIPQRWLDAVVPVPEQ